MMRRSFMAVLSLSAGVLLAQGKPPEQSTLQTTTKLVVVPTLVQTPTHEIVYSLQTDDFLLTDKGIPQLIHLDDETHQPLSLVVLMQTAC